MKHNYVGIKALYDKEVDRQADILKRMPPGDAYNQRRDIVVEIRGLLIQVDNAIEKGGSAEMALDNIERLLHIIK